MLVSYATPQVHHIGTNDQFVIDMSSAFSWASKPHRIISKIIKQVRAKTEETIVDDRYVTGAYIASAEIQKIAPEAERIIGESTFITTRDIELNTQSNQMADVLEKNGEYYKITSKVDLRDYNVYVYTLQYQPRSLESIAGEMDKKLTGIDLIKDYIWGWLNRYNDETGISTWQVAQSGMPLPDKYPFGTFYVDYIEGSKTYRNVATVDNDKTGELSEVSYTNQSVSVQLSVYDDQEHARSINILDSLVGTLSFSKEIVIMKKSNLGYNSSSTVQNLTTPENSRYEDRAMCTLRFNTVIESYKQDLETIQYLDIEEDKNDE